MIFAAWFMIDVLFEGIGYCEGLIEVDAVKVVS